MFRPQSGRRLTIRVQKSPHNLFVFVKKSLSSLVKISPLLGSLIPAIAIAADGDEAALKLSPFVVTSTAAGDAALQVQLDPKAAAQPIPAQDGADILKAIPGFSVSRKGGADGEAVLRGQAGSRLSLLLDGENSLGGCPHRMDPPTAYIFPSAYDRVTVLKGPQTVLYGPGNSAGVVLFERDIQRLTTSGYTAEGSLSFASFGRNDQSLLVKAGVPDVYVLSGGNRSQSDDYRDGSGQSVHSHYERSSLQLAAGWTPDANTLLEVSGTLSEGKAAYGYSMMDATKLDRQNLGLRFKKTLITPVLTKLEGQVYYNYVDHVMDDYSMRTFTPSMMGTTPSASNPDHRLVGGRGMAELTATSNTVFRLGFDFQNGRHRSRSTGNEIAKPYEAMTRVQDATIDDVGLFGELTQTLSTGTRLVGGLRADRWQATDKRDQIAGMMMSSANPTAQNHRRETNPGGFLRFERDLTAKVLTAYAGVGHTERAPDYWELITNESLTSKSSFNTKSEKVTQFDTGLNLHRGAFSASLAAFCNEVKDFILVQSNVLKASGMGMGTSMATVTRNVDASSFGGEASVSYVLDTHWKMDGSLAYVEGRNKTDHLALAQQPPFEGRLGLSYVSSDWSVGGLSRLVAAQDRFATNQGTIIGQDLGRTGGFAVFSLNAGLRVAPHAQLTAGVDNLFDKTYAEHLSRNGVAVTGYPVTTRINEPGRTVWVKLTVNF
jgi:iron complex outermembrane receptor protein